MGLGGNEEGKTGLPFWGSPTKDSPKWGEQKQRERERGREREREIKTDEQTARDKETKAASKTNTISEL